MPSNKENKFQEWLWKAQEDELFARSILKHRDAPASGVCFHSQQMAEKCLKGFLVSQQKTFPKIHDLLELETLILKFKPEINKFHQELTLLNSYYIETRYPGDYPEFTWQEAEKAFEAASKIKEFVLDRTKSV